MNNLEKIYTNNTNSIFGSNIAELSRLRKELIDNFDLDKKKILNNESTKHLDQIFLNNILYHSIDNKLSLKKTDSESKEYSSLLSQNINNYCLVNFNDEDILFTPLESNNDLVIKQINKYKNVFFNDYVLNLNSILMNSGFNLTLKEKSVLNLNFMHQTNKDNITVYEKNYFNIKKDAKIVLIEKFSNEKLSNSNIVNYFELEEGSEVLHLVIQNNSFESSLQYSSYAKCRKNSNFHQFIFNCNLNSGRNHSYIDLIGDHSEAKLHGVFFGTNNQIIDNKTVINHNSPSCHSNQTYKGILSKNSRASYLSKTFVNKNAQKTEGYQLSKGILLSDNSFFHSKPELKIYADDVKCSHGSTIGSFDTDQIFYLRSRGLNEQQAKSFLIKSFYKDLLDFINHKNFLIEIEKITNNWLHNNIGA